MIASRCGRMGDTKIRYGTFHPPTIHGSTREYDSLLLFTFDWTVHACTRKNALGFYRWWCSSPSMVWMLLLGGTWTVWQQRHCTNLIAKLSMTILNWILLKNTWKYSIFASSLSEFSIFFPNVHLLLNLTQFILCFKLKHFKLKFVLSFASLGNNLFQSTITTWYEWRKSNFFSSWNGQPVKSQAERNLLEMLRVCVRSI